MNAQSRRWSMLGAAALMVLASNTALAQATPSVEEQRRDFAPKELHVSVGTTVVWTNTSNDLHTVTADDASFDSGDQNPGDVFQWTFSTAGSYQYYCQYHGDVNLADMAGVVIVS